MKRKLFPVITFAILHYISVGLGVLSLYCAMMDAERYILYSILAYICAGLALITVILAIVFATVGCNISGSIPQDDLMKIRAMFDKGITLWHDDLVGNYNRQNKEI